MMMITLPIFMPVVQALGVDLVWFGVLFLICMQMGLLLPPHGLLLMTMKGVAPPQVTMARHLPRRRALHRHERAAARARLPRAGGRDLAAGADRLSYCAPRHAAVDAERCPVANFALVAGEKDDRRDLLGVPSRPIGWRSHERLARAATGSGLRISSSDGVSIVPGRRRCSGCPRAHSRRRWRAVRPRRRPSRRSRRRGCGCRPRRRQRRC